MLAVYTAEVGFKGMLNRKVKPEEYNFTTRDGFPAVHIGSMVVVSFFGASEQEEVINVNKSNSDKG